MKSQIENLPQKKVNGFVGYFRSVINRRKQEKENCFNYDIALKHLETFTGGEVTFGRLTRDWFTRFSNYLKTATGLRSEKPLSANSANTYFRVVLSVAKIAADERLIDHAMISKIPITSRTKAEVNYLNFEELNKLARTPCHVAALKNAFLFSCLTGLGWKEIDALKWENIQSVEKTWSVVITNDEFNLTVPLNGQALSLLGKFGNAGDKIFNLHYSAALCANLNKWAIRAGVYRQITFSTAKQSFGMALLNQGVPIELISELFGHRHIKSTMKLLNYEPKIIRTTPTLLASL